MSIDNSTGKTKGFYERGQAIFDRIPEGEEMKMLQAEVDKTLAWYDPTNHHVSTDKNDPLFTPLGQLWPLDVQREWVGLTEEEINKIIDAEIGFNSCWGPEEQFARAIEAKLKEKNT